jgi:FlaA1/EpsC-like NDP-sugar epimerase
MRMDEAIKLVVDTLDTIKGREINIPTLPAYRLGDLAEAMGVDYKVIGLPSWEKKHESMADGNSSDAARRMSIDELRREL